MVCSRFSAWSKTMEAGLSNTSSVTSIAVMPNWLAISAPSSVSALWNAGRQCMNLVLRIAGLRHYLLCHPVRFEQIYSLSPFFFWFAH